MTSTATAQTQKAQNILISARTATRLQTAGVLVLRYGLVFVLILWGTAKWTKAEADGIQPLVANSPLMSWVYHAMSVQHGSEFIGCIELILALFIAVRPWFSRLSALGSAGGIVMFLTTLSLLLSTPGLDEGTKGFLIKDIFLLGAAIVTAGEAWLSALAGEPPKNQQALSS